ETRLDDSPFLIGEARYVVQFDHAACEYAISVADTWRGKGIGRLLFGELQSRVQALGVTKLVGEVLRSNKTMLAFARRAGFGIAPRSGDPRTVRIVKDIMRFSGVALA